MSLCVCSCKLEREGGRMRGKEGEMSLFKVLTRINSVGSHSSDRFNKHTHSHQPSFSHSALFSTTAVLPFPFGRDSISFQ